ncbi:PREDICTED: chymotrypsin BI-like isoform X3 [Papilio polytes]|uniref:chymotrypsin BI-like isoform X1 n=1 Tax=Papilio polytes TaxID=76194 RepID=UPI0006760856|nr:PREDICTED: chymotrypsin BI-like isoform X1 [Papilio polytes]XP_013140375.1 PREDICTED: chymotrypsin BI-like isoform X2 [Papilio polytes]XP_013140376.1 PREDICTED: chymotrypsin BI-like isoform X3 [Papilio polytes]
MKFAIALLALAVAVQGRSTGLDAPITAVSTAENPWVVHLRIATTFGAGLLNSCVGSLINERWVLTSGSCVQNLRFAWIRYGAANVVNPELVTETSSSRFNNRVGLIAINRVVEFTPTISSVELAAASDELPETGTLCGYGSQEDGSPGETLNCYEFTLSGEQNDVFEGTSDGQTTEFDIGAPLVSNGKQIGVLVRPAENGSAALFASVGAYKVWIDFETGSPF